MRFLIIFGLMYVAYRAAKSWMGSGTPPSVEKTGRPSGEIDDVMVKDPFCEVYFPKRNGIGLVFEDRELLFCSEECRDKFINSHAKNKT